MAKIAKSVTDVVLGEAMYGTPDVRFEDMLAIASTIHNRAAALGVTPEQVVATTQEFNAFGKALPPGVSRYADLAKRALEQVARVGPVHPGTFYATPAAQHRLPSGLQQVYSTAGHRYFVDPQNRAIKTSVGYKKPDPVALASATQPRNIPTPEPRPETAVTMDQVAQAIMAEVAARAQSQTASLPDVGPVPDARPNNTQPGKGLAALSSPELTGMGFKSAAALNAFSQMAPEMQAAVSGIERGLANPADYTITSTSEPRRGKPSATHVRDKGAIDVRTVGMNQKQLDDLAVAAMYDPNVQSISWDNRNFAPHAHLGTSTAYGAGLQHASDISGLSRDVQGALASWDADIRSGVNTVGRMVPESIAPRDIPSRNAPVGAVERGTLPDVARTEVSLPGRVSMPDQGPRFDTKAASQPAQSIVGDISMPGRMPDAAPSIDRFSRQAPTSAQKIDIADRLNAQAQAIRDQARPASAHRSAQASNPISAQNIDKAMTAAAALAPPTNLTTGIAPALAIDQMQQPPIPGLQRVAAPAVAPPPAAVAAPAPVQQRTRVSTQPVQKTTPPPSFTGMDVWTGKSPTGTATNGNAMSRNPDGTVSMTSSRYGYTETMNPDGSYHSTTAPGLFGLDAAVNSMFSGIARDPVAAMRNKEQAINPFSGQPIDMAQSRLGRTAQAMKEPENAVGAIGTALGALFGGGVAGLVGGQVGRMAGRAVGGPATMSPKDAMMNRNKGYFPPAPGIPARQSPLAQLGQLFGINNFPTAPAAPANPGSGGLTSFGEAAARGEHGSQAQEAANNPGRGLY